MEKITCLDFKEMIYSAAYNLKQNYKKVDDLNVFPVPDGDTGSNMFKTFISGVKEIKDFNGSEKLCDITQKFTMGLLLGARGNSGVILSQIFAGISSGNSSSESADLNKVLEAIKMSKDKAYQSVSNPVEGTILTVLSDATKHITANFDKYEKIEDLLEDYAKEAEASLDRTPLLLPVLKEAGVVDSGGAGLVVLLRGMLNYLHGEKHSFDELFTKDDISQQPTQSSDYLKYDFYELNKYGYCTEFTIRLNPNLEFNKEDFTKKLEIYGYSIVVVNSGDIVKVHIHTLTPGEVFSFAQKYGALCAVKAENMAIQTMENSSLVVSKVVKKNKPTKKNKYGIVAVVNGDGLKEIFTAFGVNEIIDGGQTMNPSTQDFINAINNINAEHVFVIPNNKNVYMSAKAAKALINDKHVIVIPAKTISQGYAAMMCFDESESPSDITKDMEKKIQSIRSGEITYSIRDSVSNGIEIKKDDFIAILDGTIVNSKKNRTDSLKDLISKMVNDETQSITIFFGDNVSQEEVDELDEYLNNNVEAFHQFIEGGQKIYSYIVETE